MHIIKISKYLHRLRISFFQLIIASILLCFASQIGLCQNGLMAEYFDGNNFDRFVSSAYVDNIDNTWYDVPPVTGIDPHNCSIRWSGKLRPSKTATYIFSALVDDGIRVWIDDKLVIDQWGLNDVGVFNGKMKLLADTDYNLKVEYFNALLEGEVKLLWDIEKAKKEQSYYESIFGVEYDYTVIKSDYFFLPDRPLTKTIVEEDKVTLDGTIKENKVKKISVKEVKENSVTLAQPSPQIVKIKSVKKTIKTSVNEENQEVIIPEQLPGQVVEIMTAKVAEKYIPKNVQFERAKVNILPSSTAELDTFAKFLLDNPNINVTIEGHTETVGDAAENQKLSERRAFKIARYFVEQGISARRLNTVGYGGARPLKIPIKGAYYPKNRRVVFILIGLK